MRLKRLIVRWLEYGCWCYWPLYCRMAWWSFELDQRWGTGLWREGDFDEEDSDSA